MEMYGKIIDRGGKKIFVPTEDIGEQTGVPPGEEELFQAIEALPIHLRYRLLKWLPRRPGLTVVRGKAAEKVAGKAAKYAIKATAAARRGLLITRPAASISKAFYHKKSYHDEIQDKSRVIFLDAAADPDGLITNLPEQYLKTPATLLGIKIDIEPAQLFDENDAYNYQAIMQALTSAVVQLKVNDTTVATFSFKDIGPVLETDIAYQTAAPNNKVQTFHLRARKFVEFGDIIKSNYISVTSKDKVYLIIMSDTAFPALGSGATDFKVVPYILARVPRRVIGG